MVTANDSNHQAIVIGAGIAGLLAARVLSDHYQRVLIIDRDIFPTVPAPRKGTPQAHHIHNLLQRGLLVLESYFPGLTNELVQAGALVMDWTGDLLLVGRAGQAPRFFSDLKSLTLSRSLLEFIIHQRVAAYPNVTFVSGAEIVQLLAGNDNHRVNGVRVRHREGRRKGQEETFQAGLVADASGRSSRVVDWLTGLGYTVPAPSRLQSYTGYATREYECTADPPKDWKVLLVRDQPPFGTRSGGIYPVEGGRWLVTVTGAGKEAPPINEEGFLAFARQLHYPGLWAAIEQACPTSKIHGYARTDNLRQHFERMSRWPEGLIVTGDAACTLNPLYGQGMTVAILEAEALNQWLRRGETGFQKLVAQITRTPWLIATNQDLKLPETTGSRPGRLERVFQRYIDRIELLAYQDPAVFYTYMSISHLVKPPQALFAPALMIKVLKGSRLTL